MQIIGLHSKLLFWIEFNFRDQNVLRCSRNLQRFPETGNNLYKILGVWFISLFEIVYIINQYFRPVETSI